MVKITFTSFSRHSLGKARGVLKRILTVNPKRKWTTMCLFVLSSFVFVELRPIRLIHATAWLCNVGWRLAVVLGEMDVAQAKPKPR